MRLEGVTGRAGTVGCGLPPAPIFGRLFVSDCFSRTLRFLSDRGLTAFLAIWTDLGQIQVEKDVQGRVFGDDLWLELKLPATRDL